MLSAAQVIFGAAQCVLRCRWNPLLTSLAIVEAVRPQFLRFSVGDSSPSHNCAVAGRRLSMRTGLVLVKADRRNVWSGSM